MNVSTLLDELKEQRARLDEAILAFERIAVGGAKRRGRPPAWLLASKNEAPVKRRGRPPGSKNKTANSE